MERGGYTCYPEVWPEHEGLWKEREGSLQAFRWLPHLCFLTTKDAGITELGPFPGGGGGCGGNTVALIH